MKINISWRIADRIVTFFDQDIKERQFEGDTWKTIVNEIVEKLPAKSLYQF